MLKKWIFISLLILTTDSIAQPSVIWTKTYGGEFSDGAKSFVAAHDGGFVLCGFTYSSGNGASDIYIVRVDLEGNEIWSKTFGTTAFEYGNTITALSSGGYAVAGYSSASGSKDFYIVKIDNDGNEIWSKTFGGESLDIATCIDETQDGGLIINGYTGNETAGENDMYVVKLNSAGELVWDKKFGDTSNESGASVIENTDGSLLILGSTGSYGATNLDYFLVKTDAQGNLLWKKNYNRSNFDIGSFMIPYSDGDFILIGSGDKHGSDFMDAVAIKVDKDGTKKWLKYFDNYNFYDYGAAACEDDSSNIIICGNTKSNIAMNTDVYLIKLNASGSTIWKKAIDLSKTDWTNSVLSLNNDIYVLGQTNSTGNGSYDMMLMKLNDPVTGIEQSQDEEMGFNLYQNSPNPFNMQTAIDFTLPETSNVKLNIYDSTGRLIRNLINEEKPGGHNAIIWDGLNNSHEVVSSGIYFYSMISGNLSQTKKMILLK
ncbi:MAG: T9SS type A sorting domain-containing protein [bacterium]